MLSNWLFKVWSINDFSIYYDAFDPPNAILLIAYCVWPSFFYFMLKFLVCIYWAVSSPSPGSLAKNNFGVTGNLKYFWSGGAYAYFLRNGLLT